MQIGFIIPADWALVRGHGVVAQALHQARALESLGHTVALLNPWHWQDLHDLDVLHFFAPSVLFPAMNHRFPSQLRTLVAYSPVIDSNQSFIAYRWAAALGSISSRFSTIPGTLRLQARQSDLVIARSKHEQRRVIQSLGVPQAKVEIVLNGCPAPRLSTEDAKSTINLSDLPRDFVLHVSAFTQERKNVIRLAQAAGELGFPLVIGGSETPGPILDELKRKIAQGQNIVLLGFLDEATKADLYSRCRVFSLPSYHEGTGLVAVEAASHGANLVITRNGGPPDYFLDMAEYVDPFDLSDIKRALAAAWNRPKNDRLENHLLGALTWEHSARSLADAYSRHRESRRAATRS